MISRKRIFGIILFVVASLITFAFANPASPEDKAPSINVDPGTVGIVQGSNYDVMKGVTVIDDNDALTAVADITDTTGLSIGDHTITYTATDSSDNTATAKRTMNVLNPKEDADGDGYTNGEEVLAETDFLDVNSHPSYARSSTITLNVNNVYTMEVHGVIPVFRATANDVADGNVAVIISNNINANVVDTYTVTFRATDSLGNLVTITREFNVVDTTKPVITLNGLASYKVVLGQTTYTDDLAVVTDNYDATSTISGVINGNPLIVGVYTLDYNFTDANLNVADKVVRTINVLDPLADEDHDGYTNGEEVIANTDFNDETSMPTYDKNPIITVEAYNLNPTNQDITVNVTTNEGVLNFASHTFTENGSFDFLAVDVLGNTTTKKVTITNIDKVAPTATISYDKITWTNTNVIATLVPSEDVTVTNNGGLSTYTFTDNGTFTFNFVDAAGNTGSVLAIVNYIDKTLPELTVKPESKGNAPYFNTVHFKLHDDNLKEAVLNGVIIDKSSGPWGDMNDVTIGSYYTVIEGKNILVLRDKAGNEVTYEFYLDVTKPVITINPYIKTKTNQDITVYAITNEGTLKVNSHKFTKNGIFKFIATDLAGNVSNKKVKITNIDKVAPTATISYDKITWTNTNVIATLVPSEDVTVTNNGGLSTYTFTDNGTFTFNFVDAAGNTGSVLAIVNYIDKTLPEIIVKAESIGNAPYFNIVHFKLHDDNLKEAVLNGIVIDKSNGPWGDMNDVTIGSYYTVIEGKNILVLRDKAGNTVTYEFYLDVTAPVVRVLEKGNEITSGSYVDKRVQVQINAVDANIGKVYINGVEYPQYNGAGWYDIDWILRNSTTETNKIVLEDKAGNKSDEFIMKLDLTAPRLRIFTGGQYYEETGLIFDTKELSAVIEDTHIGKFYIDGVEYPQYNGSGWFGLSWALSEGTHTFKSVDKYGNYTELSFEIDLTKPVVRVLEKGIEITSGSYVDKTGQVSINAVDKNIGKVYINGVEYTQYNGAGWYDIDWILRNSTTETNKIVLEDKAGNKSDEFIMKLDLTAPRLRIFTGGQYYEGTGLIFDTKELSAVIEDTHIGKFYIDGVEYTGYEGAGWFGLSWALSKGTHIFKSVDKYGNTSELSFEIVIISLTFDKTTNLSSSQASNTWYTDRYSPASFTNVSFDGGNRLKESISSTASAANRPSSYGSAFYNTQGRIYDTPNATIISADLYVSSSWATTNKRMAGLWGTGFDLSNNISSYPIIEFTSDSNTPRFRAYNVIDGTWIDLGLPTGFQYDKWYSVSIEVTASNTIIYKVGDITYTFGDANGTTKIGNVILQGHNTNDGVDYDIYWDNFIAR